VDEYWTNGIATLYQADARQMPIPDQSVHCAVTSPPYFGLRVYHSDSDAMIGLEETVQGYVDSMLEVMAEVGRVLRDDGVLWVNLGDSYGGSGKGPPGPKQATNKGSVNEQWLAPTSENAGQLLMIPARFALAMQDAGWILRSDVIWAKKSCMPESLNGTRWERCRVKTSNGQRLVERGQHHANDWGHENRGRNPNETNIEGANAQWADCPGCPKCADTDGLVLRSGSWRCTSSHEHIFQFVKSMGYYSDGEAVKTESNANRRNVWSDISPEPYGGEHYATFPSDLPRLCIQASTSEAGVCAECGSQWARVVDATEWRPTCTCNADKVPATVLDCFAGTGTTLLAAMRLGRRSVGVDLSTDYLGQAVKRLEKQSLPMLI
jgi:DNA modification methylase